MKRAVSALVAAAVFLAWQPRPLAAVWQDVGEISGTAVVEGKPLSGIVVRLRNVDSGELVATATTNERGEFKFTGLPPGNYVVEMVTDNGKTLLGTSPRIALAAGAMMTSGVTVSTSAAAAAAAGLSGAGAAAGGAGGAGAAGAAAAGGAFFTTTAGIVTAIAVGVGVAGIVAARATASPSG